MNFLRALISSRALFIYAFMCVLLVLIASFIVEHCCHLNPCPLCMLQRIDYFLLVFFILVAIWHNPDSWGRRVYSFVILLFCSLGGALATRQLWLQTQPPDSNATCLPGLSYMLQTMPAHKVFAMTWQGSSSCAEIDWSFLGLSMAAWSLIFFGAIALLMLIQLIRFDRSL